MTVGGGERTGIIWPLVYSVKTKTRISRLLQSTCCALGHQVLWGHLLKSILGRLSEVLRFFAPGWMTHLLFALGGLHWAKRPTSTLLVWLRRNDADHALRVHVCVWNCVLRPLLHVKTHMYLLAPRTITKHGHIHSSPCAYSTCTQSWTICFTKETGGTSLLSK